MASHPPAASQPIAHVFRLRAENNALVEIPAAIWAQIVQHQRPLQPANATVRLLLIQGHGHDHNHKKNPDPQVCDSIDALQLQTDNFGFLLTWDASPATVLPQLTSDNSSYSNYSNDSNSGSKHEPQKGGVIDSRQRFLQRYLSHRHSFRPSKLLLAQALLQAGYVDAADCNC